MNGGTKFKNGALLVGLALFGAAQFSEARKSGGDGDWNPAAAEVGQIAQSASDLSAASAGSPNDPGAICNRKVCFHLGDTVEYRLGAYRVSGQVSSQDAQGRVLLVQRTVLNGAGGTLPDGWVDVRDVDAEIAQASAPVSAPGATAAASSICNRRACFSIGDSAVYRLGAYRVSGQVSSQDARRVLLVQQTVLNGGGGTLPDGWVDVRELERP